MQVDHKHPKHLAHWTRNERMQNKYNLPDNIDDFSNLMPSCRRCNTYKRGHMLEPFHYLMKTLHKRLQLIFINKVAEDFGIIEYHIWDGVFYFERNGL
jgi:5-methylcytosine-specific restriction endonuclease McrA